MIVSDKGSPCTSKIGLSELSAVRDGLMWVSGPAARMAWWNAAFFSSSDAGVSRSRMIVSDKGSPYTTIRGRSALLGSRGGGMCENNPAATMA